MHACMHTLSPGINTFIVTLDEESTVRRTAQREHSLLESYGWVAARMSLLARLSTFLLLQLH